MLKIIIFVYIIIGIFRVISLFLQSLHNRPIAIAKLQLKYILVAITMWLPLLILRIKNYGIKTVWRWEVRTIKNIFTQ